MTMSTKKATSNLKVFAFPTKVLIIECVVPKDDEESVVAFAEKLNMKDAWYMLVIAWDSLERQNLKKVWNTLWPDLKGDKYFNDDHRDDITDFVQLIPIFQKCDEEDVETWMTYDAEDFELQMLNDYEIASLSTMKRIKTRTKTTTKVARVHQILTRLLR
ncbi:uncharacterized protein TNCV_539031 [Trichonephila clavipes]|nr:uncharacterized protein TNCV_539031 [Trichonephila clavipes]